MNDFNASQYGPVLGAIVNTPREMALGPGQADLSMRASLEDLNVSSAFAHVSVSDIDMANGCIAGAWLLYDYLDDSHKVSQSIDTPTGSYWHGIMHRREPDYSNGKYWFRQVGQHPIFPALHAAAVELTRDAPSHATSDFLEAQPAWDPFAFVDLVETCAHGQSPSSELCRRIQTAEWQILFDYCYTRAIA
jgi:hypothetical protein